MKLAAIIVLIMFVFSVGTVNAYMQVLDADSNVIESFYDEEITPGDIDVEGYIELANPPDACGYIMEPTLPANSSMNKIVLINDTNCNFTSKVCLAKSVGYDTVVIFEPPDFSILPDGFILDKLKNRHRIGGATDCFENMDVVFIFSHDAAVIINKYLYRPNSDQNYFIVIASITQSWALKAFLAFAVWATPVIVISFLCALVRNLKDKYRMWRMKQLMDGRLRSLFPTVTFVEGTPYDNCIICLGNFKVGDKLRPLPCSHVYHPECIDAWLVRHRRRCPICNRKVLLGDDFDVLDPDPSENTPLLSSSASPPSQSNGINHSNGHNSNLNSQPLPESQESNIPLGADGNIPAENAQRLMV